MIVERKGGGLATLPTVLARDASNASVLGSLGRRSSEGLCYSCSSWKMAIHVHLMLPSLDVLSRLFNVHLLGLLGTGDAEK